MNLLYRSSQRAQQVPLGFFGAGLDVPLADVVDPGLDRVVEPAAQQTGVMASTSTAMWGSMPSPKHSWRYRA
ncbi:hypothetical protein AB0L00_26915 [Actinoallomurus sp. NPDC052308]|uniref:hypothetical protein n=1 Tax=Actinoallomurus sp. NPDC052308 TaxID=3155530 RepID=UPI003417E8EC